MQRSIVDMGMKKVHLSFGKQLYDVTIQVYWYVSSSYVYNSHFFACIGTLMKCSALKLYAIAVNGGIRGIYNGKS